MVIVNVYVVLLNTRAVSMQYESCTHSALELRSLRFGAMNTQYWSCVHLFIRSGCSLNIGVVFTAYQSSTYKVLELCSLCIEISQQCSCAHLVLKFLFEITCKHKKYLSLSSGLICHTERLEVLRLYG